MPTPHLSPEFLRLVLDGELPPKSLARLALLHVISLCPDCRRTWAAFKAEHPVAAGRFEDAAGGEPEAREAGAARDLAPGAPSTASAHRYANAFARAAAALAAHADEERERSAEAPPSPSPAELRDELLALPAAERRDRVERQPERFHGRELVEALLAVSFARRRLDPADARELAELAAEVLQNTPEARATDGGEAPPWAQGLAVRTLAYTANAYRSGGDLDAADTLLRHVRARLARFPLNDALLHAEVSSLEASLRQDQRRLADAEALLDRAALLYREAGERRQMAKVRVQQGAVFRLRGDLAHAAERLTEALDLLAAEATALEATGTAAATPGGDPGTTSPPDTSAPPDTATSTAPEVQPLDALRRDAVANLALVLCDLDRHAAARDLLEEHRALFAAATDEWTRLRCRWVEGRVGLGLGEPDGAESALAEARGGFLRRGETFNAALAALDLAVLHLEAGRTAEVRELVAEMAPIFLQLDVGPEAAAALVLFQRAAAEEEANRELVLRLRRQLLAARRGDDGAPPDRRPS